MSFTSRRLRFLRTAEVLNEMFSERDVIPAAEALDRLARAHIGWETHVRVSRRLGVVKRNPGGKWYWARSQAAYDAWLVTTGRRSPRRRSSSSPPPPVAARPR